MAHGTFENTHQRILESGKKMFLENGFERTNLRDLCARAGITTGSFYRHFESKEDLFSFFVNPAVEEMKKIFADAEPVCREAVENGEIRRLWMIMDAGRLLEYIYRNFDGLKLLLKCSDGTKYSDFLNDVVWMETDIFKRALRTVTLISLLFWALSYSGTGSVADSLLYKIGTFIEPVTRIFGLGWRTFMGFLSSAFAKEAVLGVLNAVFVGSGTVLDATFRSVFAAATDNAVLGQAMTDVVSKAEALAFMCACTFNIPCVMALSTTYRESHSLKWTARIAAFYVCGALILSCIVYHIASLFL